MALEGERIGQIREWVEDRADEMAEFLTRLIAEDTENPPGRGLRRCAGALLSQMEYLGLKSEILPLSPSGSLEDPCIMRATVGEGPRIMYFHGHFDVVPAQDQHQFSAVRREGKIVGRGSADMKGGLVSMLYGAAAAQTLGKIADGRIVLHFVCDEETGSVAGSGFLRESGLIDPAAVAMVTAEPSGGQIWNAARGAISLRVSVPGREAHVGQAYLGVNAFQRMIRIAQSLEPYAHEMAERHTSFDVESHDARGSMLVIGGQSGSGSSFNVVPGSSWFTVDGRFNPEENLETELELMKEIIRQAAESNSTRAMVEVTQFQPAASTRKDHPAGESLARCIEEVEGTAPRFEMCAGILETRWYTQLGIPAFSYGPGRLDVSHGPIEYVDEAAMRRCAAVYALYAARMLS
ncbi:MAG TPA: M20/M25/M40 family metallo-hydrolase [Thermoplasmata archaeon]|nr:M20/M25/M40 family metallo-hydrolase [Thermoplasmata archaeon]